MCSILWSFVLLSVFDHMNILCFVYTHYICFISLYCPLPTWVHWGIPPPPPCYKTTGWAGFGGIKNENVFVKKNYSWKVGVSFVLGMKWDVQNSGYSYEINPTILMCYFLQNLKFFVFYSQFEIEVLKEMPIWTMILAFFADLLSRWGPGCFSDIRGVGRMGSWPPPPLLFADLAVANHGFGLF